MRTARGSVHRDEQGGWHSWVTVGVTPNGQPDLRHRRGKTRKEVVAKVRELEKARDSGKAAPAGRPITVEEWLTGWIRDVAPNRLRRKAAPVDPRADLREWKELLVEANVREVRLHDARHSAATIPLVQGVDKRVVMELMGWSSEAMLRRYQHVVDELRRDAIAKATAYLYGPTDEVG